MHSFTRFRPNPIHALLYVWPLCKIWNSDSCCGIGTQALCARIPCPTTSWALELTAQGCLQFYDSLCQVSSRGVRSAFVSSSPVFTNWISFSCLTAQAKTPGTVQHGCGRNGCPSYPWSWLPWVWQWIGTLPQVFLLHWTTLISLWFLIKSF